MEYIKLEEMSMSSQKKPEEVRKHRGSDAPLFLKSKSNRKSQNNSSMMSKSQKPSKQIIDKRSLSYKDDSLDHEQSIIKVKGALEGPQHRRKSTKQQPPDDDFQFIRNVNKQKKVIDIFKKNESPQSKGSNCDSKEFSDETPV